MNIKPSEYSKNNKRPMGLRKILENRYIWLSQCWLREEKNPLFTCVIWMVLHLNKLESHSPQNALWQVWLKSAQWFWRRRFLNFVNLFLLFRYYLPLEKDRALHLNKPDSPSPKDTWMKLAKWYLRKFLKFCLCIFTIFRYYLPLEKDMVFHLNKVESLLYRG